MVSVPTHLSCVIAVKARDIVFSKQKILFYLFLYESSGSTTEMYASSRKYDIDQLLEDIHINDGWDSDTGRVFYGTFLDLKNLPTDLPDEDSDALIILIEDEIGDTRYIGHEFLNDMGEVVATIQERLENNTAINELAVFVGYELEMSPKILSSSKTVMTAKY